MRRFPEPVVARDLHAPSLIESLLFYITCHTRKTETQPRNARSHFRGLAVLTTLIRSTDHRVPCSDSCEGEGSQPCWPTLCALGYSSDLVSPKLLHFAEARAIRRASARSLGPFGEGARCSENFLVMIRFWVVVS